MEHSAYEAIMIGVNVFVFIAALSAGILLMSSIIDMVNFANEQAVVGMNGSLAESVGVVTERVYTGAQMLSYYRREIEGQNLANAQSKYTFNVKLDRLAQEKTLKNFIENQVIKDYLNKEFILQYKGFIGDKHAYVFSLKQG